MSVPITLVTHDLDEAAMLADCMCVLDAGEVLQAGRPAEVMTAPANSRVRQVLDLAEEATP